MNALAHDIHSPRTLLVMAGGTGGHIFGFGRATRLTSAVPTLACAEDAAVEALDEVAR